MKAQCVGATPRQDVTREGAAATGTGLHRDFRSKEAAVDPARGCAAPAWHCGPAAAWRRPVVLLRTPRAFPARPWDGRGRQYSIQGSQGHGRDQTGRSGQGGVNELGGRGVGAHAGRGEAAAAASHAGHWLRSPWPRRAAGGDGAEIGASALGLETARSPAGVDELTSRRRPDARKCERDMTWSGVTVRTAAMPSGLPEHSRQGPRGAEHAAVSVPLLFLKEPTHYAALWTSRTLHVTSSDSRKCCIRPLHHPTQEAALEGSAKGSRPAEDTTTKRATPAAAPTPPPPATPSRQPPRPGLETTASRAPPTSTPPPLLLLFSLFCLLPSSPSSSFAQQTLRLCPPSLLNSICTMSRLHWFGAAGLQSLSACVCVCVCVSVLLSVPGRLWPGPPPRPPPHLHVGVAGGGLSVWGPARPPPGLEAPNTRSTFKHCIVPISPGPLLTRASAEALAS